MSSYNGVTDTTLQKFLDKITTCIILGNGAAPLAAPNALHDRLQKIVNDKSTDVTVTFRVLNGAQAFIRVVPNDGNPGQAVEGQCSIAVLASILA